MQTPLVLSPKTIWGEIVQLGRFSDLVGMGHERLSDLIDDCKQGAFNRFHQHAMIAQSIEARVNSPYGPFTDSDWFELQKHDLGLTRPSRLYAAWYATFEYYRRTHDTSEPIALMLWGSLHKAGAPFFSDLGKVARWLPPDLVETYRQHKHVEVMYEWVDACGVTNLRTVAAASGVIAGVVDEELSRHPRAPYEQLDSSMAVIAHQFAIDEEADPRRQKLLAFYLFLAFERIAAYERVPGLVRWRSEWLRGKKANPRAIRGASTYSAAITRILHSRVLERVKGHSSGRENGEGAKAATYRLRIPMQRGNFAAWEFAKTLGLDVKHGLPRVSVEGKL